MPDEAMTSPACLLFRSAQSKGQRRDPPHRTISLAVVVLLVATAPASAQSVEVPRGYEFCGWKDFINGGWTYENPDPGVYLRLFRPQEVVRTARRNYRRVRYTNEPPFRPKLAGHRCKVLEQRREYTDALCSRRDRPKASVRWQTGA